MNTSTGTQDITVSGFGTVKAYLAFVGRGTTNGTPGTHAAWSVGAADGTLQSLANIMSEDAQASSDTYRNMETDEVLQVIAINGQDDGEANHDSFITDGIRINVGVAPPSAWLMKFLLFGGSDLSVKVGTATLTASQDASQGFTGVGFEADVIFFWTTTAGTGIPADSISGISFGFATNNGTLVQSCHSDIGRDNAATMEVYSIQSTNRCIVAQNATGGISRSAEFSTFDSDGFTLIKRDGTFNIEFHYLALNFGGVINFQGWNGSPPTSTGNWAQTWPGFTPQAVLLLPSFLDAQNTQRRPESQGGGAMGVAAFDENAEWCIGFSDEDNQADSDTQSLANNKAISFARGDGTEVFTATGPSGSGSFDASGFTLNFTATDTGTTRYWAGIAFEEFVGAASPGPKVGSLMLTGCGR